MVRLVAEAGKGVAVVRAVVVSILVRNLVQRTSFVELIDVWQDGLVDVLGPFPTALCVFVLDILGDFGQLFYRLTRVRRSRRIGASYRGHTWAGQRELVPRQVIVCPLRLLKISIRKEIAMPDLLLRDLRALRELAVGQHPSLGFFKLKEKIFVLVEPEERSSALIVFVSQVPQLRLVDDHGFELGQVKLLVVGTGCIDLVIAAVQLSEHPPLELSLVCLETIPQLCPSETAIAIYVAQIELSFN